MWNINWVLFILSVTKVCATCPNNWIGHGSSCYHFSHDPETWVDAMDICKILGANLVEIDSESENNFIQNTMKHNYAWIGITDLVEEGVWEWMTSHTPVGYTNWQPGEPNNAYGGTENCAIIYEGSLHHGWNDAQCKNIYYYVCEQEASGEVIVG